MDLTSVGGIGYPAEGHAKALFVCAHGAGAGQRHPFMTTVAKGLAAKGIAVVTFDFPYMRQQRKVPDKAPVLETAFREVITAARDWCPGVPTFIGGKSMGGRMATHLGAERIAGINGIIVFGYPLHPPGKPEQLRVAHLPSIVAPVLIVQGERDTFGTPNELQSAIETMAAVVTLHVVAGGDHSLGVRGRKDVLAGVCDLVANWVLSAAEAR
jgi:predicted alpha/beta-hydrolase family hydrolase